MPNPVGHWRALEPDECETLHGPYIVELSTTVRTVVTRHDSEGDMQNFVALRQHFIDGGWSTVRRSTCEGTSVIRETVDLATGVMTREEVVALESAHDVSMAYPASIDFIVDDD